MAITINSLAAPVNVTATLTAGGSLLPNTTYYVVVSALNGNFLGYDLKSNSLVSELSVEVSFTTDNINLSVIINWDAAIGATHYNVYLSRISGTYTRVDHCGIANYSSVSTNSIIITAPPIGQAYNIDTITGITNLPGKIDKKLGNFYISITGSEVVTIESICSVLDNAGLSNYYYYDGWTFVIKGSIRAESGSSGSFIIRNKIVYFISGSFYNSSADFDFRFGSYDSTLQIVSNVCTVYLYAFSTYMSAGSGKIKAYATTFIPSYNLYTLSTSGNSIGCELMALDTSLVIGCSFYGIRNTNTNWSNNKLINPQMARAWAGTIQTNTYYDCSNLTYYAPNGFNVFYDSTLKFNNSAVAFNMTGLNGNPYPTAKIYDTNFIGAYYNSINDLTFSFSAYVGLSGFDFYYSVATTILDTNKNLLDDVNVKCYDKDMNLVFNQNTLLGLLDKQYVRVLWVQPTGNGTGAAFYNRTFYSPFTLVISKQGYETYTTKFDLVKKFDEIITLKPIKPIRKDIEGNVYKALLPEKGSDSKLFKL